jgi:pectinesterase
MAWASPRGTAPQLLLVLSLLLAAASASLLPLSNNAPPPRLPPAAKAREGGASVSAGLLSTLREALDAVRDVASIISSFPIGGILGDGGGDLRLSSAVADCLDLLDLSSDEMSWSMSMSTDSSGAGGGRLGTGDARSDLQSWLSGALGNQDTCKEGLDATGSVLGSLVAAGLDAVTSLLADGLGQVAGGDDATAPAPSSLPPSSSSRRGAAPPRWLRARERRLLQMPVGPGGLAVDAVVAQDGSGNFTTVGAAVEAAPAQSAARYVVYVRKGVYRETVEVKKKKWNLMLVGDGMGATVISGRRSYGDGYTTYRSATVGERTVSTNCSSPSSLMHSK